VWLKWEITIFNDLPDLDLQMLRHYSTASQMVEATVCCLPWTGPDRLLLWILPGFFLSLLAHVASPLLSPFSGFKAPSHVSSLVGVRRFLFWIG
jgi:hypothetical protein